MKSRLAVAALNSAVTRRGEVAGCILHTDRGSQIRSRKLVHALNRHGMTVSMGRAGACRDNATWNRSLPCCKRMSWTGAPGPAREVLRIAIVTWIERTYHRRRRQATLDRLTPIEYESITNTQVTQAA